MPLIHPSLHRVLRILFVLCLYPVLQQHAVGSCASESQPLAENRCKSRLKAIHSMRRGAGRGKPEGRKQLPLSLGFKCAYCGGEFGSRAGMDCHRRHNSSVGTPCADPRNSKSMSLTARGEHSFAGILRQHDILVVPDDDLGRISEEEEQQPPRSQTPPTPPDRDHHQPSPSPPRPIRQRAMAQLRPVSIPNIVSEKAGPDPLRRIADFDRHYMPDGQPAAETSSRSNSDAHRSQLKQNAEGLSRSLSEVFAYLTHGTASLEEARKLLSIITNVS
uniref:C2H2-type domain-containing protein n=1 Tax=Cryptomonas curvata TaxID=233186 RepID=A0A7S0QMD2_9CRYP|mmetsp:Transcript_41738/g.87152  ORF Transcript_41738/g.87152 Transcript_41738/m.87152 type:complete len:275 (+) Transcript_41738:72-896(+)